MPWLVVGMSMYASLTSAVTFMALPGTAYRENIAFIVVGFASVAVAPVLVALFYPFYHRLRVTTSYEYVARRFGPRARSAAAGLFILSRLGWLGLVIYAPSLVLSVVSGIPLSSACSPWAASPRSTPSSAASPPTSGPTSSSSSSCSAASPG
jgi:solute:Na+ symporter, SSS family